MSGLLRIVLLWILACMILLNYSFVQIRAQEWSLGHMVALLLVFRRLPVFSIVAGPICVPPSVLEGSPFPTPSPAFAVCGILDTAVLTSVSWHLTSLSWRSSDNWPCCDRLFVCFLAVLCLLWIDVYLDLMPIFRLGCLFFWHRAPWAVCIF